MDSSQTTGSPQPMDSSHTTGSPQPMGSSQPMQPLQPAESLQPMASPQPVESPQPIESPQPVESLQLMESPQPMKSSQPMQSSQPMGAIEETPGRTPPSRTSNASQRIHISADARPECPRRRHDMRESAILGDQPPLCLTGGSDQENCPHNTTGGGAHGGGFKQHAGLF